MTIIEVIKQDITALKVEAIVNASNPSGLGCRIPGHCVDSAIHLAAGEELYEECKTLGGVPTGEAKITRGYNLPAKWIIHCTGPQNIESEDHEMLAKCYRECLNVAKANGIRDIAFCCISTGLYGFGKSRSCNTAFETVMKYIGASKNSFDKIIFCTYGLEDYNMYVNRMNYYKQLQNTTNGINSV